MNIYFFFDKLLELVDGGSLIIRPIYYVLEEEEEDICTKSVPSPSSNNTAPDSYLTLAG